MAVLDPLRRHPVITGVMLGATVLGVILGLALLPGDWGLARKVIGGALAGAGCGLLVTAPKMF